jgi:hypothetical protein
MLFIDGYDRIKYGELESVSKKSGRDRLQDTVTLSREKVIMGP